MSRHLVTLHARDRAGSAVSGVRWRFYPYEASPAWLTFSNGVYSVNAGSLPAAQTIYSSADEGISTTIAELLSGADGTPADLAYLPAGRYIAIGSIGSGAGTRYWVVKDYILGVRETTNAIDAEGTIVDSVEYLAIVDQALADIANPHIGKRVDVTNFLDADSNPAHSTTYVYRGIGVAGADWLRDEAGTAQEVDQTAQPTSARAASGIAVEDAISSLRDSIAALTVRVGDLENPSPALTADIENS